MVEFGDLGPALNAISNPNGSEFDPQIIFIISAFFAFLGVIRWLDSRP